MLNIHQIRLVFDSGTDGVADCSEKTGQPSISWSDWQRRPPLSRTMDLCWFNTNTYSNETVQWIIMG